MKKFWIVAVIVVALSACSGKESGPVPESTDEPAGLSVITSNYPLKYFVDRIGGSSLDSSLPVPDDIDPAFWEPTAEDIMGLQEADLIILNGASYETWRDKVTLNPSSLVITTADAPELLIKAADETTHSHGVEGSHSHTGTAFTTWLDTDLAILQAAAVRDSLTVRLPDRSEEFEAAYLSLVSDLQELDTNLVEIVTENHQRPVLFSHPVYQYFENRYNLNGYSLHWEPDVYPDAEQWKELEEILAEHPAQWMIWEGTPMDETRQELESLGIGSVVFSPCGNVPESGDYLEMMEANLGELQAAYR